MNFEQFEKYVDKMADSPRFEIIKLSIGDALEIIRDVYNRQVNPWISVEDKLPEKNTTVFIWTKNHERVSAEYNPNTAWYDGIEWHTNNLYVFPDWVIVTHWMPVPELPTID